MWIGLVNVGDVFRCKEGWQSVLPEQVLTFHFAFCLGRWRILKGDTKPLKDFPQVCQHVRQGGEEETVKVHIQRGRQTAGFKGPAQKIQVCQQIFPRIQSRPRHHATTIINHVKQRKKLALLTEPVMGRHIQLPQSPHRFALPTADGSRFPCRHPRNCKSVSPGPTTNRGPIYRDSTTPQSFRSCEAIRGWPQAGQQLPPKAFHLFRGCRVMRSTRACWGPVCRIPPSTGRQIITVQPPHPPATHLQFIGHFVGANPTYAYPRQ